MMDIFGTLGPACKSEDILNRMFAEGMTGIRINLSHTMLDENADSIEMIRAAAKSCGVVPKILIDLQGPELRIGDLTKDLTLNAEDTAVLVYASLVYPGNGIPVSRHILDSLDINNEILLDDGKIAGKVITLEEGRVTVRVSRGGVLKSRKSIAVKDVSIDMPTLTSEDIINLRSAVKLGITGVMQPFVRGKEDILTLRNTLDEMGGHNIRIYAKIENLIGIEKLDEIIDYCDELIIARGDLGNAVPLWDLIGVQKDIAGKCSAKSRPFMVVTQMLASMENSPVPTRAEVSDIYNAVLDKASSVMVTGETAVGRYPVETITYLSKTVKSAEEFERKN